MLVTDGDIVSGLFRERIIIKRIIHLAVEKRSPLAKKYLDGISRATNLNPDVVRSSKPFKNYLEKLFS
jgi:hypothetical protein